MRELTEQQFLTDVSNHEMTVLRDDGLYRHLHFQRPETYCMSFDLLTWPGYLAYSGDMGSYVFTRTRDMFDFFRGSGHGPGLSINLQYWAEKVVASDRCDGIKRFSEDRFRETVLQHLRWSCSGMSRKERRELFQEVRDQVWDRADDGEHAAFGAAHDFSHKSWYFDDFSYNSCEDYTFRYLWCCYALAWGIRRYDEAKQTSEVPA